MRKSFLIIILVLFYCPVVAQLPAEQQKAIVLKRMVEKKHFSPRPVNDSFSLSVFRHIINTADPRRLLFTSAEYKQLSAYSTTLDDELLGKGWSFYNTFSDLYKKALIRTDTIIQKLMQKPFDLSVNDTIGFTKEDHYNFAYDNAALTGRWAKYLKLQMLYRIYEVLDSDSTKKTDLKTVLATNEPSIREKVKQKETRWLKKILNYPGGYPVYIRQVYLNAVASAFDPHTNYFTPDENEKFHSSVSAEAYSFGIDLDENNDGRIVIERLVPGGPAWRSGEIHKGDELISLQWEGKVEVNVDDTELEEVYAVLEESIHDRIVFTIKKTDGTIKQVLLRKEKMENEENIVKSFVLKGEKKIGYILLPGFYTEWENESGSSCANDVAKEIVKLKRENIDGLILDVRFNGGGSLGEALEMAGIFIDEGPLFIEKDNQGKQFSLKDPNRGTIYTGPLALMVNGPSASASEVLAATLQDYNRAIIVGSHTYGKATMQQLFSLDTISNRAEPAPGKEMIKITVGKLYRLTGETTQLKGVVPDIILPDIFDGLEYREKFSPHALSSDTAKKNTFYKPLSMLPVKELAQKNAERITNDTDFLNIKKVVDLQYKLSQQQQRFIPLKWEFFEKWRKQREAELDFIEARQTSHHTRFTIDNHQQDKQWIRNNEYAKEVNAIWMENIGDDIYIRETFLILCDLINLQKTTNQN